MIRNPSSRIRVESFGQARDGARNGGEPRQALRSWFHKQPWNRAYDLVEYILTLVKDRTFIEDCNRALTRKSAAYRLVQSQLIELTKTEQLQGVDGALTATMGIGPVNEQLRTALARLADRPEPDCRNAMKEAISVVETLTRLIAGTSGTLSDALKTIEKRKRIALHSALNKAWQKIYGYTSDEGGVRHSPARTKGGFKRGPRRGHVHGCHVQRLHQLSAGPCQPRGHHVRTGCVPNTTLARSRIVRGHPALTRAAVLASVTRVLVPLDIGQARGVTGSTFSGLPALLQTRLSPARARGVQYPDDDLPHPFRDDLASVIDRAERIARENAMLRAQLARRQFDPIQWALVSLIGYVSWPLGISSSLRGKRSRGARRPRSPPPVATSVNVAMKRAPRPGGPLLR